MSSLWQRISDLFTAAEQSSPSNPALHEVLRRDDEELADYARWKRTLARRRLLDYLNDQYAQFTTNSRTDQAVSFLDTPSSKGFVLHLTETQYSETEVRHFFHYLAERIRELNYRTQIADRRMYNRPEWVETQERYYLKPRTRVRAKKAPARGELQQRYGNITLELELRDDHPYNLRLRATTYQDSLYADPHSFGALLMALSGTSA